MKLRKTWAALLLLLCLGLLGKSGLLAADKTVPVTVKIKAGKGVVALYETDQKGKMLTDKMLLRFQNIEEPKIETEGTVEVKANTAFVLFSYPNEEKFPYYDLYKVERVVSEAGKEDKREQVTMKKGKDFNSYTSTPPYGFKEDTKITKVVYEVTFTDAIDVTFTPPAESEGVLTLSYFDKQTKATKTLTASGKIPIGVEFLNISLTSKKLSQKPEVKYTSQVGTEKLVDLTLEKGKWTGKIPLDDVLKLNIVIRYIANDVLIAFDAPPADKGTVKVTYMKDGATQELTSGMRVPINTELSLEVTKAQASATVEVAVQKEGSEEQTKVEMTAAGNTYTGKVIADASLKFFFRFATTGDNPGTPVEDAHLAAVTVAPNPFDAQLVISNIAQQGVKYTLLNTNGTCVLIGEITGEFEALETSILPSGLYLLQLTTPDGATRLLRVVKR